MRTMSGFPFVTFGSGEGQLEVFVLGAGFSKGFHSASPLMRSFFKGHESKFEDEQYTPVKDFASKCGFSNVGELNVETLFTLASLPKPWLDRAESFRDLQVTELLKGLIEHVIFDSFPRESGPGNTFVFKIEHLSHLQNFAVYLLRDPSRHVITFNYDTLLDQFLEKASAGDRPHKFRRDMSYGFRGQYRPRVEGHHPEDGPDVFRDNVHLTVMKVLKLHGSLNWYRQRTVGPASPNDIFPEKTDWLPRDIRDLRILYELTKFIVPPILDKSSLMSEPLLSLIWTRAADLISQARKLIFIGYSLPATDYYSELLFRRFGLGKEITVVGTATDKAATEARYREVFGDLPSTSFDFRGAVEYCANVS